MHTGAYYPRCLRPGVPSCSLCPSRATLLHTGAYFICRLRHYPTMRPGSYYPRCLRIGAYCP